MRIKKVFLSTLFIISTTILFIVFTTMFLMTQDALNYNHNENPIKEISIESIFWGGIRVNTITLSKYDSNAYLTVSVVFDKEKGSKGISKKETILVQDAVWEKAIDIIEKSQQKLKEVDAGEPIKRDVITKLKIFTGDKSGIKHWDGYIESAEIIHYLDMLADKHTDILKQ